MANKIAEAVLVLKVDGREMDAALLQIPKQADKAAESVSGIGKSIDFTPFKQLGAIAAASIGAMVAGIVELGNRGAQVDDVAGSFEALTAKTGETADVMIGKLREGVVGTLSDYDLMVLANKTLGSGLVKTSEDMGVLAAGARTLAKATGETTKEAFDTLTSAMASGRTAALKQVGLFVDSKVAVENYAAALGKNVSQLTDHERAQALSAAALTALRTRMKEVTPDAADFGEMIDQAKVRLANFKDQIAVGIAKSPVFAAGMNAMGQALGAAFGTNQKNQASAIVTVIENLAISLTYAAQAAIGIGKVFVTVFAAIETLVNGVLTVVVGFATGIVTVVDGLARLRAALPLASDESKALAVSTTALRRDMDAMTQSLANSTAEAAKGVIGQGALHEKLDAMSYIVMLGRDAMVAAGTATAETTRAVVALGQAAPEAAAKNQDMAAKVAEAFRALNEEIVAGTKMGLDKRLFEIETAKQKELAKVEELKFETVAKHDEMVRLVIEKYRQKTDAAILAGDEILAKERAIQQDIALLQTTGTAHKLLQIDIAKAKEIASLEELKAKNLERYNTLLAAINVFYGLQTAAAQGHYATLDQMQTAFGIKTRAELQQNYDNAQRLLAMTLADAQATEGQITAAKKAASDAQQALEGSKAKFSTDTFAGVAASASSILRDLFGKNKAAAIAATAIDAAAALVKAFAQGGILGFASAAAITAATAKQIITIKNQKADGFAQGTPGLDFADFGAESWHPLHNQEAVIPRGGGHALAGEIADSMPGQDEQLSLIRRLVDLAERAPAENRKAFRNAMILDMA